MANSVLYFPSIRVPEADWFTHVLLYWDSVGTIVPFQYLDDPKFLRPYTAGLMEHGLVKAVEPDRSIWQSGARNYYAAFVGLIDSDPLVQARIKATIPLDERETVRIHADKTGTGLASELVERGLARPVAGPEYDTWFDVERRTGNLLMAYLAAVLGRGEGQEMDPITDSEECLTAFAGIPGGDGAIAARKDPIRTEILADILPAPAPPIVPADLAKFKEAHWDQLVSFRTAVEQCIVSAAAIDDPRLRAEKVELTRRELKGQLEEITRRMRERGWRRIGAGALVAIAASALTLGDAVVTGGTLTLAGNSLGLVSAVYGAFQGTRTPSELLGRPMAYAALARRRLAR